MSEINEFSEHLNELMGCSEENLSNCLARRKQKTIKKEIQKLFE